MFIHALKCQKDTHQTVKNGLSLERRDSKVFLLVGWGGTWECRDKEKSG